MVASRGRPGRIDIAPDKFCGRISHDHNGLHIGHFRRRVSQGNSYQLLVRFADRTRKGDQPVGATFLAQHFQRFVVFYALLMKDLRDKTETRMIVEDVHIDVPQDDALFDPEQIKKIKVPPIQAD